MATNSHERGFAPVVPAVALSIGSLFIPSSQAQTVQEKPVAFSTPIQNQHPEINDIDEIHLLREKIIAEQVQAAEHQRKHQVATFYRALDKVFYRLATCESNNNPHDNTGNGFYGEYQFDYGTWLSNGGGKYAPRADLSTAEEQTRIAERLEESRGWEPWPSCSEQLHLGERFILNGYVHPPED